jgi:multiple sugar transport system substrate-binding protein
VTRYRGLTWDHPRGYNALAAAAAQIDESRDGLAITWDKQPLEGFESHPIADLCARYDLVVLDHPHVGEAVTADCLLPLEDVFSATEIAEIDAATIGPCLSSYEYAGRHWALPLDAATQVMAYRADRIAGAAPTTWDDVIRLSERAPVALSVAGPHAVLSLFSVAAALGDPTAEIDPDRLVGEDAGLRALDIIATLHARMPDIARLLNPIGLLGVLAKGEGVALCPLVYGYVNYAAPSDPQARPVAFANAPRAAPGGRPGSTLGGTGIGLSKRCKITPALLSHLRWLMGEEAQTRFIPSHDGQPSRRSAWRDAEVNRRWGGFYQATAETLERAYVRPRHAGYIAFQTKASAAIRDGLAAATPDRVILSTLDALYRASRPAGAER